MAPKPAEVTRQSGINAVRNLIPRMLFDRENCRDGIEALRNYRTEYDEKRQIFSNNPLHDWTSDYADSLRYYAITRRRNPVAIQSELDYSNMNKGVY